MIGEIRDTETAQIAVRASITGHLVLSTLHTNDSLTTIERLLDMDVQRYLLASALSGIVSQKLARKLCPKCKKARGLNEYEKELFKKNLGLDIKEIYSNEGCDECNSGYAGRIAIQEVLLISQEIRDAISNNVRKENLRDLVYNGNVITMLQDGLEKVVNGDTTLEEVLKLIELENDDVEDTIEFEIPTIKEEKAPTVPTNTPNIPNNSAAPNVPNQTIPNPSSPIPPVQNKTMSDTDKHLDYLESLLNNKF
jgi:Tfp pilus assembly pilus retraction ATPase PilT